MRSLTTVAIAVIAGSLAAAVSVLAQPPAASNPIPVLAHVMPPRHSVADLLARLRTLPEGQQQLARAGLLGTLSATTPPAIAPAVAGWPAQFLITADATRGSPASVAIGMQSITTRFEHRGAIVDWDASGQLVVTWVGHPQPPSSVSVLSISAMPPGWYVVAVDMHFGGPITSGTTIHISDAYFDGTCVPSGADVDGNSVCVVLEEVRGAVSRNQYLIGMNAGQGQLLGVTLARAQ